MKRLLTLLLLCLATTALLAAIGCDWNVPNEDTEKEKEKDCAQNPDTPGFDCADACCIWDQCEGDREMTLMYEDYEDCVARCDEALFIDREEPIQNEKYKNCVLTCIFDCEDDDDCRRECEDLYPD